MASVTRLEDYRPPDYLVDRVDLDVALDARRTQVAARLALRRADGVSPGAALRLDGLGLTLVEIAADGVPLSPDRYIHDARGLTLLDPPDAFELATRVEIDPSANRSALGLFLIDDKLATQCEPEGLRRITFFPDRPDVLARYTVRLEAEKARFPVLLSNGNPAGAGDLPDGRHWARWDDPSPKPCYIFAIFAGAFARLERRFTTASGRPVAVAIHANADVIADCGFAMDALVRSLAWDERALGREYDLDTYNVVALAGWGGATENKGLNLFGANGIVADPATTTDDEFVTIERIVGHEQFHNWTGNRVTCRDWFQLALKEGLTRYRDQCFMEDRLGAGAWRIEIAQVLRRNQFPEDDGPFAHPVQPRSFVDIDNFYTATIYEKGAEIVRMLATLLGEDGFAAGLSLYLDRHDGGAATIEDFVRAMEAGNGRDLAQFRRWYAQPGRPRIAVEAVHDAAAQRYVLTFRQRLPLPPGAPLHVPIRAALIDGDGRRRRPEQLIELQEVEQRVVFEGVAAPPVPSLLRGFSAPVTIDIARDDAALALLMAHDDDPFARWDAAQTFGVRTVRAIAADPGLTPDAYADAFAALLESDTDPHLLAQLITLPDEPVLSEGLAEIPLDAHRGARDALRGLLVDRFGPWLRERHAMLAASPPGFDGIGRRKLRNACLDLLCARPDAALLRLLRDQAIGADTMTDGHAALLAIVHVPSPERDEAIAGFHARWAHKPTVVDRWFAAQALSRAPGAIDAIIALEDHPDFSPDNIARLMAYYGSLFRQNRVAFHDRSGKGYAFLADRLLVMDALGRGGSSWVMPQINQWRRHDAGRSAMMRAELERIAGTDGISAGLRESVEAALA